MICHSIKRKVIFFSPHYVTNKYSCSVAEPTPTVRSALAGVYFMNVQWATRLPEAEEEHVEREQVIVVADAATISASRQGRATIFGNSIYVGR